MRVSRSARLLVARFATALAVVTGVLVLAASHASPAGASTADDEIRLYALQNDARADNGLAPLSSDSAAANVARSWAQELARSGNLRHNPNLVSQVDAYVTRDWTRVGENVGYSGTIDQVFNAYMNSPGHRANILGDYNRVGIGAVRDPNGRLWTAIVFVKGPALPGPRCEGPTDDSAATSNSVARLYRAYFLREPDADGQNYWVPKYRSGEMCLTDISEYFTQSAEFRSRYGSLDATNFVRLVYENVLGREPDADGYRYWTNRLSNEGMRRGTMMVGFSESPEFRGQTGLR